MPGGFGHTSRAMNAYLSHPVFELGSDRRTLADAAAGNLLWSDAGVLAEAGFEIHHRAAERQSAYDLALACARKLSQALEGEGRSLKSTHVLLYATCLPVNANCGRWEDFSSSGDVKHLLDYPASHLQSDLGMDDAIVIGLEQQACTSMLGAIRLAALFLAGEPSMSQAMCLTADRFPRGARYEQAYNFISDGAGAVLVSREPTGFRVLACHQITNGAMARASDDETVGFYFSYTQKLLEETLAKAGMGVADLAYIVAQNTNRKAWQILAALLKFDYERVLMPTIGSVGHVISGDNIVNLAHADAAGRFRPGDRVLLTMAGYGLNWQAVLLEKV